MSWKDGEYLCPVCCTIPCSCLKTGEKSAEIIHTFPKFFNREDDAIAALERIATALENLAELKIQEVRQ